MSRMIDLTGQRFSKLTVIDRAETHYKPNGSKVTMWNCVCDCGNKTTVSSYELRNGGTKSCGCLRFEKTVDLTGQTFGYLTVTSLAKRSDKKTYWNCKCKCGKMVVRRSDTLTDKKHLQSCGCMQSELLKQQYANGRKTTMKDLTNQRFGRLLVLRRDPEKKTNNGSILWICQCDCGNIVSVSSGRLRNGTTQSCGCYAKQRSSEARLIDLSGKTFGNWSVISRAEDYVCQKNGVHCPRWLCKCSCGQERVVFGSILRSGSSCSCGCLRESKGEKAIAELLEENRIKFEREYSFADLLSSKGAKLKFDFALFDQSILKCLVEFQGEQHYETDPSKSFGYAQRTYTDIRKKVYCERNGIQLYEIRYDEDISSAMTKILLEEGLI